MNFTLIVNTLKTVLLEIQFFSAFVESLSKNFQSSVALTGVCHQLDRIGVCSLFIIVLTGTPR